MMQWNNIDSAPRDGRLFIGRNAKNPNWGSFPMMRRVTYKYDDHLCDFIATDLGAWLMAHGNGPCYESGEDSGRGIPYSVAPDKYNTNVIYEWIPIPGDNNAP